MSALRIRSSAPDADGVATTLNATITAHLSMPFDIPFVDAGTWPITVKGVMRCGV